MERRRLELDEVLELLSEVLKRQARRRRGEVSLTSMLPSVVRRMMLPFAVVTRRNWSAVSSTTAVPPPAAATRLAGTLLTLFTAIAVASISQIPPPAADADTVATSSLMLAVPVPTPAPAVRRTPDANTFVVAPASVIEPVPAVMLTAPHAAWVLRSATVRALIVPAFHSCPRALERLSRVFGYLPFALMLKMIGPAFKSSLPPDRRDALVAELRRNDPRFVRRQTRRYLEYLDQHRSLAPRLCDTHVPAWVAFGEHDDIGITDDERRTLEDCPHVTLVTIPEAGHFTLNQKPDLVAMLVVNAIDGKTPG